MNFLAPVFMAGAAAIALPVLFHLIRRTTREKTVFSSLMFLLPSPPRLTRRSRLEHILLLTLRCLVLCLLALGFSRPFLRKAMNNDPGSGDARRIVMLLDTSASMRRANLWPDAVSKAENILRQTSSGDQVAIFTFDRQLTPLLTFDQWSAAPIGGRVALASGKLAETTPGWSSTHLGDALVGAAEALADTGGKQVSGCRQIVLISDVQEGSRIEQLQGYEWPKGVELAVEVVKPKHVSNAGIQLAADNDDGAAKGQASVRIRVGNAADSRVEQFKVGWAQSDGVFAGPPIAVYVPPGQSRVVAIPMPSNSAVDRIRLMGDEEEFDNTVFVIPPEPERFTVGYFGEDSTENARQPLYFLQRAFQETKRRAVQIQVHNGKTPLTAKETADAALLVVTDAMPEERSRAIREMVTNGKTLLCVMTSDKVAPTLASLVGLDRLGVEEVKPANYSLLGEIDFRNPLFLPFADPRFSDFTKIHFWKYRRVDISLIPAARTVAKFDSGDPAILEVPVGKGRVVVFTSGWQPEDSQLALSTKFVPMLYTLLEQSGAGERSRMQYHVGDVVALGALAGANKPAWSITRPDGSPVTVSGETNFTATAAPGIYSISSLQPPKRFAVNLDPAESRTGPLPLDELERLGAPMSQSAAVPRREMAGKARLENSELENRQKLWRWLIVAALLVLIVETWVAGRTARVREVPDAEAPQNVL